MKIIVRAAIVSALVLAGVAIAMRPASAHKAITSKYTYNDDVFPILRDRGMNRPQQVRLAEWFGQEVDGSRLERAHGARDVAVARQEYDLRMLLSGDPALQLQAVDVRQLHVQDQAGRELRLGKPDVLRGRSERDHIQVCGCEELVQRFAHAHVVIDDKHDVILRAHRESRALVGSVKLNVAPPPGGLPLVAHSRPW